MGTLAVYVPKPGTVAAKEIAPASAIVGAEPTESGHVMVYYEGNLYDYVNLTTYLNRLSSAAGRLVDKYPTVARKSVPADDLIEVGRYDPTTWKLVEVTNEAGNGGVLIHQAASRR